MSIVIETLGRLYLWEIALNRITDLLALRKRVDRFVTLEDRRTLPNYMIKSG